MTDADEQRVVTLLARDVFATVGPGYEATIRRFARTHRELAQDLADFTRRLVDDVQQYLHDVRVDTAWPRCPHHPNHPMWFRDGWWCADSQPVVRLGDLGG